MNPRPVILDTDWYTDVDDVMAVRVLINLQRKGLLRILGVCLNARFDGSVRSVDAFLQAHGVDVPVGIVQKWEGDRSGLNGPSYQRRLASMPSKYTDNEAAENPAILYRRLLASSSEPVELFSIGFTENYQALLESRPDEISPLTGRELVMQKVSQLWLMAGHWPTGQEYNLSGGVPVNPLVARAGSFVLANWPTSISFLGYEIGCSVLAGDLLPSGDLLRQAMDDYDSTPGYRLGGKAPELRELGKPRAHFSWDPLLILLGAGIVAPENGYYDQVQGRASSNPENGVNSFTSDPQGPHRYVVKKLPDAEYGKCVDAWL